VTPCRERLRADQAALFAALAAPQGMPPAFVHGADPVFWERLLRVRHPENLRDGLTAFFPRFAALARPTDAELRRGWPAFSHQAPAALRRQTLLEGALGWAAARPNPTAWTELLWIEEALGLARAAARPLPDQIDDLNGPLPADPALRVQLPGGALLGCRSQSPELWSWSDYDPDQSWLSAERRVYVTVLHGEPALLPAADLRALRLSLALSAGAR